LLAPEQGQVMRERLQKIIAQAGISSRRAAEQLITGGHVRVNGVIVTELGTQADAYNDKVEVDGKRLVAERLVYAVLHKPKNVVSTMSDPEGRPTVAELLRPLGARLYPVGRLDFATSGVLLATNDGDFSQGLLHPKKEVPKTYVVKAQGTMEEMDLDIWRKGVDLEDGKTLPARVRFLRHEDKKTWFEITIKEGRNQQIRRMGEATGFFVMRLARLSFAGINHEGLRPGQARSLTGTELKALKEAYGVPKKVPKDVKLPDMPTARRDSRGRMVADKRAERAAAAAAAAAAPRWEGADKRDWVGHAKDAAKRNARPSAERGERGERGERPKVERGVEKPQAKGTPDPFRRSRSGEGGGEKPVRSRGRAEKPHTPGADRSVPAARPRRGKGRAG
jgi:23S rRNA pseudouridine2605 synthase